MVTADAVVGASTLAVMIAASRMRWARGRIRPRRATVWPATTRVITRDFSSFRSRAWTRTRTLYHSDGTHGPAGSSGKLLFSADLDETGDGRPRYAACLCLPLRSKELSMLSNRLAFAALAVACISAAAGGGYLASRQNAVPTPASAQVQPQPVAAPAPAPVPPAAQPAQPVQE